MRPSYRPTISAARLQILFTLSRTSSGSRRSFSAVKPERSEKKTVTWRCSWAGKTPVASSMGAAH
jgi:hypothetical protein